MLKVRPLPFPNRLKLNTFTGVQTHLRDGLVARGNIILERNDLLVDRVKGVKVVYHSPSPM